MALFRRKQKVTIPTEIVEADPEAFAPIPPPAPYLTPIWRGKGDRPQGHTDVQKHWAREPGDESDIPPKKRRRYADNTEYLRDLSTAAVDGIGHTTDPYRSKQIQSPDPRWPGVDPNIGKRPIQQISNPDKFTYFRPFEQDVARNWGSDIRVEGDPIPIGARQGNYAVTTWRLTTRQDPTSGEAYDLTPAANSSRVSAYNASSGIRRSFRL